jgi:hypothetical protein
MYHENDDDADDCGRWNAKYIEFVNQKQNQDRPALIRIGLRLTRHSYCNKANLDCYHGQQI